MESQKQTLDISYKSIFKIILVILGLLAVYYLRDIIFILFISIILVLILNPAVDVLERKKIPRAIGALTLFFTAFLFLGLVTYLVAPPLAKELSHLASVLPLYFNNTLIDQQFLNYGLYGPLQDILVEISGHLKNAASSILAGILGVMGGFISAILILVISFYLVIEKNGVERFVKEAVPNNLQPRVLKIVERIQLKLSRWFIGQLSLGFIVGSMSFVGLHLLGVPYALVLGIIAGILELIPYLGPTLSAIPAIIIAFTVSPILALLTLILYFLIQQFENYLIVPKVMEKSVNLHPVIIIIVILIGGKFAGITGAILAVPTATIISIVLDNFYNKKTKNEG
jgi:predicted PurR-regulated permease PerM